MKTAKTLILAGLLALGFAVATLPRSLRSAPEATLSTKVLLATLSTK